MRERFQRIRAAATLRRIIVVVMVVVLLVISTLAYKYGRREPLDTITPVVQMPVSQANDLAKLQSENKQLREERDKFKQERDGLAENLEVVSGKLKDSDDRADKAEARSRKAEKALADLRASLAAKPTKAETRTKTKKSGKASKRTTRVRHVVIPAGMTAARASELTYPKARDAKDLWIGMQLAAGRPVNDRCFFAGKHRVYPEKQVRDLTNQWKRQMAQASKGERVSYVEPVVQSVKVTGSALSVESVLLKTDTDKAFGYTEPMSFTAFVTGLPGSVFDPWQHISQRQTTPSLREGSRGGQRGRYVVGRGGASPVSRTDEPLGRWATQSQQWFLADVRETGPPRLS